MRMVRVLTFASLLAIFSLVPAARAEPAAAETVQDGKRITSSLEVREGVKTADIFPNGKPAEDQPVEAETDPFITNPILIWDLAASDPDPRNLRLAGDLKDSKDAGKYV
jgi:hypothetical protein